jgi:hypothetical protein
MTRSTGECTAVRSRNAYSITSSALACRVSADQAATVTENLLANTVVRRIVSVGAIGTAVAQQHLRNTLAYLDTPTLGQPEAFIQAKQGLFEPDGSKIARAFAANGAGCSYADARMVARLQRSPGRLRRR